MVSPARKARTKTEGWVNSSSSSVDGGIVDIGKRRAPGIGIYFL
jgi:hypothetical protein